MKDPAGKLADRAREILKSEMSATAEAGRDMISEEGRKLAGRLHERAARDDVPMRGRLTNVIADGVDGIADDLRNQSLSSLIGQTEDFARRHPGAFIAVAALSGFALGRFLRASDGGTASEFVPSPDSPRPPMKSGAARDAAGPDVGSGASVQTPTLETEVQP